MFTLFSLVVSLFVLSLIVWTIATLVTKKEFEKLIREELRNMFEITRMLLVSVKSLIQLLIKSSFPSKSNESNGIDEQLLKFVPPVSEKQDENKAA